MLPGATTLARHVAHVRDQANSRLWRRLLQLLPSSQYPQLESRLAMPEGTDTSLLEQLRRPPILQSGAGLLQGLERLSAIRALGRSRAPLRSIPPNRLTSLARFAMSARTQAIKRRPTTRRLATLLAFVYHIEASAADDVLDIFDAFFTVLFADAQRAGIKERVRTLKDLDAAALDLATIGAMVLDPSLSDGELRDAVLTIFTPEAIADAIAQVADLAHPPDDTYYDELAARYRRLGRVRPRFLGTMSFEALPAAKPILAGYGFLQRLEAKPRPPMREAPRVVIARGW